MSRLYNFFTQSLSLIIEQRENEIPLLKYLGPPVSESQTFESVLLLDQGIEQGSHDHAVGLPVLNCFDSGCFGQKNLQIRDPNGKPLHSFQCTAFEICSDQIEITLTDAAQLAQVKLIYERDSSGLLISYLKIRAMRLSLQIDSANTLLPIPQSLGRIKHLGGSWSRELVEFHRELSEGRFVLHNQRGRGSHQNFPGMLLYSYDDLSQTDLCMGIHLGWSGNFEISTDVFQPGFKTLMAGELMLAGEVILKQAEVYTSPRTYIAISNQGQNGLRQQFHQFCRSVYAQQTAARPHFNTWEACYFEQNTANLDSRAKLAAELGIKRILLDDGWFINRNSDRSGLGNYAIDLHKYPGGFDEIQGLMRLYGLELGIWLEPEMISPDVAAQFEPDWVLSNPDSKTTLARNQLALDLSNPKVYARILQSIDELIKVSDCRSIKWDMNRDRYQGINAAGQPIIRQQTLQLYNLLAEIKAKHSVEIEICSSGGARMDYGVLPWASRFWISDNNDPLDRISKFINASIFFPPELLGMHIGPKISHTTGRAVSFKEAAKMALFGDAGFEIDLIDLDASDRKYLQDWMKLHAQIQKFLARSSLYQLTANESQKAIQLINAERSYSLVLIQQIQSHVNSYANPIALRGLNSEVKYEIKLLSEHPENCHLYKALPQWMSTVGQRYSANVLMSSGLRPCALNPGQSILISLEI